MWDGLPMYISLTNWQTWPIVAPTPPTLPCRSSRRWTFPESASAALKLKYAPLDGRHRVRQIIDDLAKPKENTPLLQLAIDEGLPASRAAADKLADIEANRENYAVVIEGRTYHPGVMSLFRLIAGVGDKDLAPLLEHFTHEHDDIATYAYQELGEVRRGLRSQWGVGY